MAGASFGAAAMTPFAARGLRAEQVAEFWNYFGAGNELKAVEALMQVFQAQHPDMAIANQIVPGADEGLQQKLRIGMMGGALPAVSQFATGYPLQALVKSGKLLDISDVWQAVGGDQNFPEGLRRIVSLDGQHFAMPLGAGILGNCFYNKAVFDKLNLSVPTNWDEFSAVCDALKGAGITPLGASSPAGYLFYQTYGPLLSVIGQDGIWAMVRGELAFTDPSLRQAFTLFRDKLAMNFSKTWSGAKWSDDVDRMMKGEVGMYVIGDWGAGYMDQRGWTPGVDYDFFAVPGFEKTTIFQADVLVAFKGEQEAVAKAFLSTVASPEGQAAFNKQKGSLAVAANAPSDFYTSVGKREFDKMTADKDVVAMPNPYFLLPSGFHREVATAVEKYAATFDEAGFTADLQTLETKRKTLNDAGSFINW